MVAEDHGDCPKAHKPDRNRRASADGPAGSIYKIYKCKSAPLERGRRLMYAVNKVRTAGRDPR